MKTAREIIDELYARDLLDMAERICVRHGVTLEEALGRRRFRCVAQARHAILYELYTHRERHFSYPDLGRIFGLDHTSVMAAVRKVGRAVGDVRFAA